MIHHRLNNRRGWISLLAGAVCLTISLSAADLRLIDAVKRQDSVAVRRLLVDKTGAIKAAKPIINATEADGSTALHWAAQRNDLKLVELLLASGANAKAATRYN